LTVFKVPSLLDASAGAAQAKRRRHGNATPILVCYVTHYTPHKALKLIAWRQIDF